MRAALAALVVLVSLSGCAGGAARDGLVRPCAIPEGIAPEIRAELQSERSRLLDRRDGIERDGRLLDDRCVASPLRGSEGACRIDAAALAAQARRYEADVAGFCEKIARR